ncbi:MAG: hypothetical protein JSS65_13285 [Armatimonadetes bacterium]|nr:hypothetical protein [Armatimonadota bacterium]
MKHTIALLCLLATFFGAGCASSDSADENKETKPADVKVDIPKEKQDEIAKKFKEGNFSKK